MSFLIPPQAFCLKSLHYIRDISSILLRDAQMLKSRVQDIAERLNSKDGRNMEKFARQKPGIERVS
jgi:hypothetical protein